MKTEGDRWPIARARIKSEEGDNKRKGYSLTTRGRTKDRI